MLSPLLEELWPFDWRPDPGYIEVRCIREVDGKPKITGQFFQYGMFDADAPILDEYTQMMSHAGWDVYYGVLPRLRPSGTNADVPDTTPFLWADVDAKKVGSKPLALAALNAFPAPPHIVVDSGGGYHAYWLLTRPEPLDRAQEVMRWIAKSVDGDNVQDGARILRVPGTYNRKREPILIARYVSWAPRRPVRLSDLEGQMPVPKERIAPMQRVRVDELPDWLAELVTAGAPEGQRSEACFRAMVWLLRYGRTPDEIRSIFQDSPAGIGAKMAEKTRYAGDRWFDYTLTAAEAVA